MSTPSTQTTPAPAQAPSHSSGTAQPQAAGTPQPPAAGAPHATAGGAEGAATDAAAPGTAPGGERYPEQKHAGAVGYGPNYQAGPGFGDKVSGLKEELKGKVMHKPDVVQHGHDLRTGELQRKEKEADDNSNPFKAGDDQQEKKATEGANPPGAAGGNVHPSEKGAKEQAATVGSEGRPDPKMIG